MRIGAAGATRRDATRVLHDFEHAARQRGARHAHRFALFAAAPHAVRTRRQANSNVLHVILRDHGFRRVSSPAEAQLLWLCGAPDVSLLLGATARQRVNKFVGSGELASKVALWRHYERMRAQHGAAAFDFMPQTFVLPEQQAELQRAMADAAADAATGGTAAAAAFIFKPAAASRGLGIQLHPAAAALPAEVCARAGVASRYVHPPLLLDGLKSDLRLYAQRESNSQSPDPARPACRSGD